MRKLRFILDMPHGGKFVGGIASMINGYMAHSDDFASIGFDPAVIDLSEYNVWNPRFRKISNIINMFRQGNGVRKQIKKDPDVDVFIHTSIKWTLAKDLFMIARIHKHLKGKLCIMIHHAVPSNFFYGRFGEKIGLWIIRKYVDKLMVLSKSTEDYFIQHGIAPDKVMTLYTFHGIKQQAPVDMLAKTDLVFMGTHSRWKGIFDLAEAVKQLPSLDYKVHMCGTFPDPQTESAFHTAIAGIEERFVMHGYVSGEEKLRILNDAAIMVLPSKAEGMPVSIMEGMACGCAIISTAVGAIPEVLSYKNGILIEPGNVQQLTDAIYRLTSNKKLLVEIQENNIKYSAEYTIQKHIEKMCAFIAKQV